MLGQRQLRSHFVELHLLDAGRLVLGRLDDAGLDGVVDLVIGDHGRRRAQRIEDAGPDRGALHADRQALHLFHVGDRPRREDVARAAARIAEQPDVGLFENVVGDRLQRVGFQHLVPVILVTEQERHVHQRRHLREGGHVGGRSHRIIHRQALVHVGDVVLLEAQFGVQVHLELDGLFGVAGRNQLLELAHRLGEGVILVELARADQLRLRSGRCGRTERHGTGTKQKCGGRTLHESKRHIVPPNMVRVSAVNAHRSFCAAILQCSIFSRFRLYPMTCAGQQRIR